MSAMEEIEEDIHEAPLPSEDVVDTLRKERVSLNSHARVIVD